MENLIRSELFLNALAGGTAVAVIAGLIGYFLVVKALAFASEALIDISFAGATGAVLLGVSPILGMVGLGVGTAVFLGVYGERMRGRDIEVGVALSFALGLGVLFLNWYAHSSALHASAGVGILFGSLMSVRPDDLVVMLALGVLILAALGVIGRPLLFASIDPVAARARGVPLKTLNIVFLILLACTTAIAVMIVGVLLAVSLLVAPAASAANLSRRPARTAALSVLFGVGLIWIGLGIAFFSPWRHVPVGFSISTTAALLYGCSLVLRRWIRGRQNRVSPHADREVRG